MLEAKNILCLFWAVKVSLLGLYTVGDKNNGWWLAFYCYLAPQGLASLSLSLSLYLSLSLNCDLWPHPSAWQQSLSAGGQTACQSMLYMSRLLLRYTASDWLKTDWRRAEWWWRMRWWPDRYEKRRGGIWSLGSHGRFLEGNWVLFTLHILSPELYWSLGCRRLAQG